MASIQAELGVSYHSLADHFYLGEMVRYPNKFICLCILSLSRGPFAVSYTVLVYHHLAAHSLFRPVLGPFSRPTLAAAPIPRWPRPHRRSRPNLASHSPNKRSPTAGRQAPTAARQFYLAANRSRLELPVKRDEWRLESDVKSDEWRSRLESSFISGQI